MKQTTQDRELPVQNISDLFSFQVGPTMVAILKAQGEATVLLDEEVFIIIKESLFETKQNAATTAGKQEADKNQRELTQLRQLVSLMLYEQGGKITISELTQAIFLPQKYIIQMSDEIETNAKIIRLVELKSLEPAPTQTEEA